MSDDSKTTDTTLRDALAYMGFEVENTGGTAYITEMGRNADGTRREMLITGEDGELPTLGEPVQVWIEDPAEPPDDEPDRYPTLADALLDLYGHCEGDEWPVAMARLRPHAVAEWGDAGA